MLTSLLLTYRKYRRCSIKQTPPIILHYSGTNVHQQGKNTLTRHHLLSFLTFFFFFFLQKLFVSSCCHNVHSRLQSLFSQCQRNQHVPRVKHLVSEGMYSSTHFQIPKYLFLFERVGPPRHLITPLAAVTYFVMCSCVSVLRNAFKHCMLIN